MTVVRNNPPDSGIMGLPAGTKEQGKRVDFRRGDFKFLIETKGVRLAWTRAADCPCTPVNTQTKQPNPNCDLCGGKGWLYFGPKDYVAPEAAGDFDTVQQAILDRDGAAVIRGIITSVKRNDEPYNLIGKWVFGTVMVSVRPENTIGYFDRLVSLDSEIAYTEIATSGAGSDAANDIELKFPAIGVNFLRSETTIFTAGSEFQVSDLGKISWLPGKAPAASTRMTVHYLHHPTWLVWDHPHAFRETSLKIKADRPLTTPLGNPQKLPIQAMCRLEFLELAESSQGSSP